MLDDIVKFYLSEGLDGQILKKICCHKNVHVLNET